VVTIDYDRAWIQPTQAHHSLWRQSGFDLDCKEICWPYPSETDRYQVPLSEGAGRAGRCLDRIHIDHLNVDKSEISHLLVTIDEATSFAAHSSQWILDSGASENMTGDRAWFESIQRMVSTVRIATAGGASLASHSYGSVHLANHQGERVGSDESSMSQAWLSTSSQSPGWSALGRTSSSQVSLQGHQEEH